MKFSTSIKEIAGALSKLQSSIKKANKSTVNTFHKNQYSTIEDVWDSIRELLSPLGLFVSQEITSKEGYVCVTTFITHASGEWMEFGALEIPCPKKDCQGVGIAITYGKKYALCAALGIVSGENDDDGNGICDLKKPTPNDPVPNDPVPNELPPIAYLTFAQCEEIDNLIGADQLMLNKILNGYNVKILGEIESKHFLPIVRKLKNRNT